MKNLKKLLSSKYSLGFTLLLLVTVYLLSALFHPRMDLTKEKRYTVSKATKELVRNLDSEVSVQIFLKGDFPAGFQKLANATEEFLQTLKEYGGRNIQYNFISPEDEMNGSGRTYADTLVSLGANPINLTVQVKAGQQNKLVFPVAIIKYKGSQSIVNLYAGGRRFISAAEMNSAEAMMEYQFAKAINNLVHPEKPLIAYSMGNGEPTGPETYDLQQTLRKDYQLFTVNLHTQKFIPDTFKVLMVVKPAVQFTEDEKLKIDQYIMRGGKVIFFMDNLYAEQDSLRFKPEITAYDRGLNLTDILFRYGVRINTDLVMDLQCDFMPFAVGGTAANPQFEFLKWNYYPVFDAANNHTINRNLGLIAGRFTNSVDTVKSEGVTKTILLATSGNSRTISTPAIISLNENRNAPEDVLFRRSKIPVGVLLEGRFTSLYRNRITSAQNDSLAAANMAYIPSGSTNNKMIIVADGDIVLNDVSRQEGPLPMGMNYFNKGSQYEYQLDNKDFLQNCIEYLINDAGIIETRNKDIALRLLDTLKVKEQKNLWQFINIGLPVLLILLFGWLYQWKRRKTYAS
jgi:gliding-associated putative ABC transporter substrate-binding component GldG